MAIIESDKNEHSMIDVFSAEIVSIDYGADGKLWVNVDGVCRLRIMHAGLVQLNGAAVAALDG